MVMRILSAEFEEFYCVADDTKSSIGDHLVNSSCAACMDLSSTLKTKKERGKIIFKNFRDIKEMRMVKVFPSLRRKEKVDTM